MHPDFDDCMVIVMLNEISDQLLPRLIKLSAEMEQGYVIRDREIVSLIDCLEKVRYCESVYPNDQHCQPIFSSVAHLLSGVITQGLENEERRAIST